MKELILSISKHLTSSRYFPVRETLDFTFQLDLHRGNRIQLYVYVCNMYV